jgi:hypothetical protein
MKELISSVIALDKKAQEDITSLLKEKDSLTLSLKKLQSELETKYAKKTAEMLLEVREAKEHEYEQAVKEVIKSAQDKAAFIQANYDANKDKWLDELLAFCLK